jgi:hypothetical protein
MKRQSNLLKRNVSRSISLGRLDFLESFFLDNSQSRNNYIDAETFSVITIDRTRHRVSTHLTIYSNYPPGYLLGLPPHWGILGNTGVAGYFKFFQGTGSSSANYGCRSSHFHTRGYFGQRLLPPVVARVPRTLKRFSHSIKKANSPILSVLTRVGGNNLTVVINSD